ncbi:hypothetical protein BD626DRAFT_401409 [Schizophyllum amplum]|uniref:RecF/RecN/SMC N-terminal domain-containing protein n=1 Tax=Schizophyllum amplum TaxID=97359 RepID=A0A550CH57_9AGAR|nr:hypothetical protein BD626DRAFT_401409 [Auriculariopsis ampla]
MASNRERFSDVTDHERSCKSRDCDLSRRFRYTCHVSSHFFATHRHGPKRRVESGDDDEVEYSDTSPAPKRVRTANGGEGASSSQNRRAKQEDDNDEDLDVDVDMAQPSQRVDEDAEDERMRAAVRASIEKRHNKTAGIAEHGIIESIEMSQFMCHKLLSFEFGPQINFIIGHNGSGKSAVLSAITVALGGKTASTGRGAGLKAFIREGQSVAEVSIMLKNQGDEAYKPREYGKSIVITRRFTKDGNSSWKIKSKDGRVVSTKKDELSAICDHMGIQVDNPLNVLTQDSARQFLSAANPGDKYKFFLKGTQLQQLSEEYETCLENIHQTSKILEAKKEALPDLVQNLAEVTAKFQEANKAREQKKKIDDLKKEKAWAHVKTKEVELENKLEEVEKATRRLPRITEALEKTKVELDESSAKIIELNRQMEQVGDVTELQEKRKEVGALIQAKKNDHGSIQRDIRSMNETVTSIQKQISKYDDEIKAEKKRMAADTQAKRQEMQDRIEQMKAEYDAAVERADELSKQATEADKQAERFKARGLDFERRIGGLRNEIQNIESEIRRMQQANQDQFANYGRNIGAVVHEIQNMRWSGEVPLGPLGQYVKARDPRKWGMFLSWQMRSLLDAFVITDARDRKQLQGLLQRHGNQRTTIIITERDIFDYAHGEPHPDVLTVLRALEFSDEFALRVFINQLGIERQILSDTRREGEQLMRSMRGQQRAWTLDGFRVTTFAAFMDQKRALEAEYNELNEQYREAQREFNAAKRAGEGFTVRAGSQARMANTKKRQIETNLHALRQQAAQEDPTSDIGALEAAKEAAENEKRQTVEQFADINQQKAAIDAELLELTNQSSELKAQIEAFFDGTRGIEDQLSALAERRVKLNADKAHYQEKLQDEQAQIDVLQEAADVLTTEFREWTKKALEYCPRVENPRKVSEIERNLSAMQHSLKERERRHGKSVEEMTVEVNKARAKVDELKNDLKAMNRLNKQLKWSLTMRLTKWQEFRRHIALRCKYVFQYHLSQRGYYGKVLFDHDAGTLTLKVQTDDQAIAKGGGRQEKDPRSLSGGEKSFSTICLLLSLWESIGCPLRCLDEFDVFMDAVNRRISMRMMIDTANTSDRKQYILITPQDMGNVSITDSVKVHRMSDPERRAVN